MPTRRNKHFMQLVLLMISKIEEFVYERAGWYISNKFRTKYLEWEKRNFILNPLQILSYGGGTQSTAMLILMYEGKIPMVDLVIHSDTGSELPETMEFIQIAKEFVEEKLKIPFVIVNSHRGTLHDDYMKNNNIPIRGFGSCTSNFKIKPQRRFVRAIVGRKNKHMAIAKLGITIDESKRRSVSDVKWLSIEFPLLDIYPISREECIKINSNFGWKVQKSGCFCCPHQSGNSWKQLKLEHPELFEIAVKMEELKFKFKKGKIGLFQENRLSQIDSLDLKESKCESSAGCFL
jgi:3'-phosphoadenosine 5'-phosphosulfate sulfotransferase (PAPS reductase)/FAD synthetase